MIFIFVGPTLGRNEVDRRFKEASISADILGPVSQGDVYTVAREKPWAIGIIDGYFERLPAVWHKEILWALDQGIHVYGAASMGALRAAELDTFGMIGVGSVYEAFSAGALSRDDEVTISHAPAEFDYRPITQALVDIRATLSKAVAENIISHTEAVNTIQVAANIHYKERNWTDILAVLPANLSSRLEQWIPEGYVSAKRNDALALVERMTIDHDQQIPPQKPQWTFNNTAFFRDACLQTSRRPILRAATPAEAILDELRLQGPQVYENAVFLGMAQAIILDEANNLGLEVDTTLRTRAAAALCSHHGLSNLNELSAWLLKQGVPTERVAAFLNCEAEITRMRTMLAPEIRSQIIHQLQKEGKYAALAHRAQKKQRPEFCDPVENTQALTQWYFEDMLGIEQPSCLDTWLQRLDLSHKELFFELLASEKEFISRT